jgi:hypothetical protein
VKTVRNYVRDGRLKAVRIGKQYRIAREDLEAFMGGVADTAEVFRLVHPGEGAGVRRSHVSLAGGGSVVEGHVKGQSPTCPVRLGPPSPASSSRSRSAS